MKNQLAVFIQIIIQARFSSKTYSIFENGYNSHKKNISSKRVLINALVLYHSNNLFLYQFDDKDF